MAIANDDVCLCENATLGKNDRSSLLSGTNRIDKCLPPLVQVDLKVTIFKQRILETFKCWLQKKLMLSTLSRFMPTQAAFQIALRSATLEESI